MQIKVVVTPKSAKNQICGFVDSGELRVRVTGVPEDDKANKVLCTFLAKKLGVPKSNIKIIKGKTSRHKIVELPFDNLPEDVFN